MKTINYKNFYKESNNKLKKCGVEFYKNDTTMIFAHVLKIKPSETIFIDSITKKQAKTIKSLLKLRCQRVPLQHIIGHVEFLETKLKVNKNVLIPRFETELLADLLVKKINNSDIENMKVLDLCCGSGAIGISIGKNTKANVTLSDVSTKAIKVAKRNARLNKVKPKFIKSDIFEKIKDRYDIIVSNPPYIKTDEINELSEEVKYFEPILALDGGENGYYFYEEIAFFAKDYLNKNGFIYFEIGKDQHDYVKSVLTQNKFKNIEFIKDYDNIIRFVKAQA